MLSVDKLTFIKKYAMQQFQTCGYSKVTMDEIAVGTGTGKGTLYKYFPSKEILLIKSLEYFVENLKDELEQALSGQEKAEDKLMVFLKFIPLKLGSIQLRNLSDIEINVPRAYQYINESRKKIVYTNLSMIIKEGKSNGLFRAEIDDILLSNLLIGAVQQITLTEVIQNLPYTTLDSLIRGILDIVLNGCMVTPVNENKV